LVLTAGTGGESGETAAVSGKAGLTAPREPKKTHAATAMKQANTVIHPILIFFSEIIILFLSKKLTRQNYIGKRAICQTSSIVLVLSPAQPDGNRYRNRLRCAVCAGHFDYDDEHEHEHEH
jgi:hypothetical protein